MFSNFSTISALGVWPEYNQLQENYQALMATNNANLSEQFTKHPHVPSIESPTMGTLMLDSGRLEDQAWKASNLWMESTRSSAMPQQDTPRDPPSNPNSFSTFELSLRPQSLIGDSNVGESHHPFSQEDELMDSMGYRLPATSASLHQTSNAHSFPPGSWRDLDFEASGYQRPSRPSFNRAHHHTSSQGPASTGPTLRQDVYTPPSIIDSDSDEPSTQWTPHWEVDPGASQNGLLTGNLGLHSQEFSATEPLLEQQEYTLPSLVIFGFSPQDAPFWPMLNPIPEVHDPQTPHSYDVNHPPKYPHLDGPFHIHDTREGCTENVSPGEPSHRPHKRSRSIATQAYSGFEPVHPEGTKFPCGMKGCTAVMLGTWAAVKDHLREHFGSDFEKDIGLSTSVSCFFEDCTTRAIRLSSLPKHIFEKHFQAKSLRCRACRETLSRAGGSASRHALTCKAESVGKGMTRAPSANRRPRKRKNMKREFSGTLMTSLGRS